MKVAVEPNFKSKTFCSNNSFAPLREEEIKLVDNKLYQKVFVIFLSLSTILIFPETPIELQNICETYNSKKICNVW